MPSAAWLVSTGLSFGVVHVVTGLDHLGAIATLAAANSWSAFFFGIKWGCGHSTALILLTAIFLAVGQSFDLDKIGGFFDWAVGVTMIVLGIYSAWLARRMYRRPHEHFHGGVHDHPPSAFFHTRLPHLLSLKGGSISGSCMSMEDKPRRSLPLQDQHPCDTDVGVAAAAVTVGEDAIVVKTATVAAAAAANDVGEAGVASAGDADESRGSESSGMAASRRPSCSALLARGATEQEEAQQMWPQPLQPGDLESGAAAERVETALAVGSQTRRRKTWNGLVAFGVGLVHGLSGTGGALGVLPAVALADWGQSMLYISMFSVSSIVTMGCLAAAWGVLTDKVSALRGPSGAAQLRLYITVATSVVCVLIGVLWLILTGLGLMGIFG